MYVWIEMCTEVYESVHVKGLYELFKRGRRERISAKGMI
jgi:hypothetical protein